MTDINYLAIFAAAVANMVIGALWYGPLFGKQWLALSQFSPEKMAEMKSKGMGKSYFLAFIASLATAFVLWRVIVYKSGFLQSSGVWIGTEAGFWLWLGFAVPITLGSVLWEGKPWKLWVLNNAYFLVVFKIMGAIIASLM